MTLCVTEMLKFSEIKGLEVFNSNFIEFNLIKMVKSKSNIFIRNICKTKVMHEFMLYVFIRNIRRF